MICSPMGGICKIHCPSRPLCSLLPYQPIAIVDFFTSAKWRKLARCALCIVTPNYLKSKVSKCSSIFDGKIMDKSKAVG